MSSLWRPIIGEDLVLRHAARKHPEDRSDRDSQTSDARDTAHLIWIDRNPLKVCHLHVLPCPIIAGAGPTGHWWLLCFSVERLGSPDNLVVLLNDLGCECQQRQVPRFPLRVRISIDLSLEIH
jgi:hypothetical protein